MLAVKDAPPNEDEMIKAIFKYIDRIFNIVRPRKLLYMAIGTCCGRQNFQSDCEIASALQTVWHQGRK